MLEFLHHLFLPRESNNHRSKILHHKSLVIVILFLFISQFVLSFVKTNFSGVLGISTSITAKKLGELTNHKRVEQGFSSLTLNNELSKAAALKGQDMFSKNYWAHNAPDGTTPWSFFKQAGYDYVYAGENLARGFTTPDDAINAWMASPTHKENMLSSNYNEVGFAVLEGNLLGEETVLIVEMFGSRQTPFLVRENNLTVNEKPQEVNIPAKTELPKKQIASNSDTVLKTALNPKPLIDSRSFSLNMSFIIISLFILVLAIDMLIIERKKIIRLVGHNVDHILFLGIIMIFIIILTRGTIL